MYSPIEILDSIVRRDALPGLPKVPGEEQFARGTVMGQKKSLHFGMVLDGGGRERGQVGGPRLALVKGHDHGFVRHVVQHELMENWRLN